MGEKLRNLVWGYRGILVVALLTVALPTRAWIFPEHAEITRLGLDRDLPPELREKLESLLELARVQQGGLCPELTIPFARLWSMMEVVEKQENAAAIATGGTRVSKKCVPFSVLPALAGDHSISAEELGYTLIAGDWYQPPRRVRFGPNEPKRTQPLAWISFEISKRFDQFLDEAPLEVSRIYRNSAAGGERSDRNADGLRHRFFRSLDVRLNILDDGYSDRARGSRAHFQDTSTPIQTLLERAVGAGDLDNALAQTFAHHMRSLQLAYAAGRSRDPSRAFDALLEHAFALHFLQDAFASGHFGTEHAVTRLDRLRRHDYLNRVGLPAVRIMSVRGCNSATASDPSTAVEESDRCWMAYGDGYLDGVNAARASDAVARVSAQVALAFERGRAAGDREHAAPAKGAGAGEARPRKMGHWDAGSKGPSKARGIAERLLDRCSPYVAAEPTEDITEATLDPNDESRAPKDGRPGVLHSGPAVAHLHQRRFAQGVHLRIVVETKNFAPQLSVHSGSVETVASSDEGESRRHAELTFRTEEEGDYFIVVSSESPRRAGNYKLTISKVRSKPVSEAECKPLFKFARLFDPAPSWTLPEARRSGERTLSVEDRVELAKQIVTSLDKAFDRLGKQVDRGIVAPAEAGASSSSQPNTLTKDLIGSPFLPCKAGDSVAEPVDRLCDRPGDTYRFGAIDTSLVRPILTIWPGPTATIQAVRGEDSFGAGIAGQAIFGAGVVAAFREEVPWAVSPLAFGLGLSGRADRILPGSRVNREVIGVNLAAFPLALSGVDDTRFVLAGFNELRVPVVALFGALSSGTSLELWSAVDIGPTGARLYWTIPNRADGSTISDKLRLIGWDVEVLNVRISRAATSARTAAIGDAMDTELRLRLGSTDPSVLDRDFPSGNVFTVALEISSGYSVFLWQVE